MNGRINGYEKKSENAKKNEVNYFQYFDTANVKKSKKKSQKTFTDYKNKLKYNDNLNYTNETINK